MSGECGQPAGRRTYPSNMGPSGMEQKFPRKYLSIVRLPTIVEGSASKRPLHPV